VSEYDFIVARGVEGLRVADADLPLRQ